MTGTDDTAAKAETAYLDLPGDLAMRVHGIHTWGPRSLGADGTELVLDLVAAIRSLTSELSGHVLAGVDARSAATDAERSEVAARIRLLNQDKVLREARAALEAAEPDLDPTSDRAAEVRMAIARIRTTGEQRYDALDELWSGQVETIDAGGRSISLSERRPATINYGDTVYVWRSARRR